MNEPTITARDARYTSHLTGFAQKSMDRARNYLNLAHLLESPDNFHLFFHTTALVPEFEEFRIAKTLQNLFLERAEAARQDAQRQIEAAVNQAKMTPPPQQDEKPQPTPAAPAAPHEPAPIELTPKGKAMAEALAAAQQGILPLAPAPRAKPARPRARKPTRKAAKKPAARKSASKKKPARASTLR